MKTWQCTFFTSGSLNENERDQTIGLHVARCVHNSLISPSNETLCVKNGICGVHGGLVFGSIANETLLGRERNIRGGGAVTLCKHISRIYRVKGG